MGSYHKWDDFTYMDKCAWLFHCISVCIYAVARISEVKTVSAFEVIQIQRVLPVVLSLET